MPDPDTGAEQARAGTGTNAGADAPRPASPARTPVRTQLVVAVILGLVGFGAITQIRSHEVDSSYSGLREQDLIDVLEGLAGTTQRTQAQIDELIRTRADLRDATTRRRAALEQARGEADDLAVLTGTVPVTGPGIRLTITAGEQPVSVRAMLDTVQELRTSGAEAISINGEVRVVAQTAFAEGPGPDGTDGLVVDGTALASPYVVDVIGAPSTLEGALDFALGPRMQLEGEGATLTVEQLESLDIDTVRRLPDTEYAQPDS